MFSKWFTGRRQTGISVKRARATRAVKRPGMELLEDRLAPAAGLLDPTFGTGGQVVTPFSGFAQAEAVVTLPDNSVVAVGSTFEMATGFDFALAKYLPDGSLDSTFGTGGLVRLDFNGLDDMARAVVLMPGGKILAVGTSLDGATGNDFALARFNADGSPDLTFGVGGRVTTDFSGADDQAFAVALRADGSIMVGGHAFDIGSFTYDFALAAYSATGTLDGTFGAGGLVTADFAGGDDRAESLAIQADGNIVAGGSAFGGSSIDMAVARFDTSGALDGTFGVGGWATADFGGNDDFGHAVTLVPGGGIVLGGQATDPFLGSVFALVKYDATGSLDAGFGTGGVVTTVINGFDDAVQALVVQIDGKVVAGGYTNTGAGYDFALARYFADGTPDTSFGPTATGITTTAFAGGAFAYGLTIQNTGQIVAAGVVDDGLGNLDFALARYLGQATTSVYFDGFGNLIATDIAPGGKDDGLVVTQVGANLRFYDPTYMLIAGAGVTQIDEYTVEAPVASITGQVFITTLGGNDIVTLQNAAITGQIDLGTGNDNFVFGGSAAVTGTIDGGTGANTLTGDNGGRTFTVTTPDGGTVNTVLTGSFSGFGSLAGGTGADSFSFSTGTSLSGAINGGGGSDQISGTNAGLTYTVNGAGTGTIATILPGGFSGIESLSGGSGGDTFSFGPSGFLSGSVNGNGGSNSLSYSTFGQSVAVVLTASGANGFSGTQTTSLGGGFQNIDNVTGSTLADTLTGRNVNSTWTLNGSPQYNDGSNTLTFASFESIFGGSGNDTFNVTPLAAHSWTINGGAPVLPTTPGDTLNLFFAALVPPGTSPTLILSGPGAGGFTLGGFQPITYTSIETFTADAPIPNVVINATPAIRDFRLVRNGVNLEVYDITGDPTGLGGSLYFNGAYASLLTLAINGTSAQDNRVVLDFGGSLSPVVSGGFAFSGDALANGGPPGTDRLDVARAGTATNVGRITSNVAGAASGGLYFEDNVLSALGGVATYAGLEGLDLSGGALTLLAGTSAPEYLTFAFDALAGPTAATFADAAGAGVNQVTGAGFVPTLFANPGSQVKVTTNAAAADTVSLAGMDATFAPASLWFDGDDSGDVYRLTSAGFVNAPAPILLLETATFDLNGFGETLARLLDANPGTSRVELNGGAVLAVGDATNFAYNGVVAGTGGLVKQGAGTWTLGGPTANTYTGTTTVTAGTLELNKTAGVVAVGGNLVAGDGLGGNDADVVRLLASGQIISTAAVTVRTTGLLDLNGFDNTLASLALESGTATAATVATAAGTLTLTGGVALTSPETGVVAADVSGNLSLTAGPHAFAVANGTVSATDIDLLVTAVVTGAGGITKTGAGVLQLSALNNTYAGSTSLDAGTLYLSGSLTGAGAGVVLNGAGVLLTGAGSGVLSGAGRGVTTTAAAQNAYVRDMAGITNTGGVGVLVGASAKVGVTDSTVTGNSVNVRVNGPAGTTRLFLEDNDLSNGTTYGLDVQGGAWVDAGQVGGGSNFTGLGAVTGSTGGNLFNGYAGTVYAIRNFSNDAPNALAGPQGGPTDAMAQGNTFNGTPAASLFGGSYAAIENVVFHDFDAPARGFVNYVTNPVANPQLVSDANGPALFYSTTATAAANNGWLQRSMIRRARMSFTDFVFFAPGGLALDRTAGTFTTTGGTYAGAVNMNRAGPVVFDPFSTASRYFNYDFGFSNIVGGNAVEVSGSLVDGRYLLDVNNAGVTTYGGAALSNGFTDYAFYRLFGDFNTGPVGVPVVNAADQSAFTAAYRSVSSQANYREYFNFDADNDVDGGDQTQFNRRRNLP